MASSVGIREAKINFSLLMKKVRRGLEVVITDRGKPIGRIVPLNRSPLSLVERVRDLEMRGIVEEKKSPYKHLPPPIPVGGGIAQKILQEGRN
jgi:prevent-host-death family protein